VLLGEALGDGVLSGVLGVVALGWALGEQLGTSEAALMRLGNSHGVFPHVCLSHFIWDFSQFSFGVHQVIDSIGIMVFPWSPHLRN
jgi:hypothetical protein